jgi:hypothetical protein
MISLKAFLPQISRIFSTTPAALYERQRALVRLGLLEPTEGRGPGSGVPLSADNLAALIIALAVTDNLSDTDKRVQKLCDASPGFGSKCKFTGATTFRDAFSIILGSVEMAGRLEYIGVNRAELSAMIGYRQGRRSMNSPFYSDRVWSAEHRRSVRTASTFVVWPAITTNAMIGADTIQMTSALLANALAENNQDDGGVE